MESKLYEECHEGGGFMAEQAMLKQDETVRTQIPTMKPLDKPAAAKEAAPVVKKEEVKKSKKLLKFVLDDGTGTDRVILSGIHEYYEPEELVGRPASPSPTCPPPHDGHRLLRHAHLGGPPRGGCGEAAPADGG